MNERVKDEYYFSSYVSTLFTFLLIHFSQTFVSSITVSDEHANNKLEIIWFTLIDR